MHKSLHIEFQPELSLSHLQKLSGCRIVPVVATVSDFDAALKNYSGALDKLQNIASTIDLQKLDLKRLGEVGSAKALESELLFPFP